MTVQYEEAVVTAAHIVHDNMWFHYWRNGKTELRPAQVIESIRDVRVKARVNEDDLPKSLVELLDEARGVKGEHGMVRLARLIEALKGVYLPPQARP